MTLPNASAPTISVIIPVWRDLEALHGLVPFLLSQPSVREVIVALADATPAALATVEHLGARVIDAGTPNRGAQMDAGAAGATGDWLLFHHADTEITAAHIASLAAVSDRDVPGGAFYRRFDSRHPRLMWLEPIERFRNRTSGALYGDQSIFARRDAFNQLGGFRGLPLMEDVDFTRRMRRAGRVILLDPPIASSPRKHIARGSWRTTFQNILLLVLYSVGVSPRRLHAWYYPASAGETSDIRGSQVARAPKP